jgi:integrase
VARKNGKDRGLFERPKSSGIWWIRYVGPDRREHVERGGTKTQARTLLARRKTEIADGQWQPPYGHGTQAANRSLQRATGEGLTLGAFAEAWLKERKPHLTPQVEYNYRLILRTHLLPHRLACRLLAEINDGDVAELVNDLVDPKAAHKKPLSAGRVNDLLKRLRSIFRAALRRKLIANDPMEYVERLREPKSDVDPFDLDEALRIIDAAAGWERAFLSVLLFTGMRPGELLALPWPAVDFEHGLIRVRRTVHPRFGFGLPKTPGSERDIEMCATVRVALMEQRSRSQLRGELVFPSQAETPIDLQNFRLRNWPRILRRAKVRPRVLYQCRHTFVRLAFENGDHPQHIAAMLGHVSTEMVFKRYGRWMKRPESAALASLDAAIRQRRVDRPITDIRDVRHEPRGFKSKAGHDSGHDSRLRLTEIR